MNEIVCLNRSVEKGTCPAWMSRPYAVLGWDGGVCRVDVASHCDLKLTNFIKVTMTQTV